MLRMPVNEALTIVNRLIDNELKLAEDGDAHLDAKEIQALGVASKVLSEKSDETWYRTQHLLDERNM